MRIAAATYGGVTMKELEEMSFARYEKIIEIVNRMNAPRKGKESAGENDG